MSSTTENEPGKPPSDAQKASDVGTSHTAAASAARSTAATSAALASSLFKVHLTRKPVCCGPCAPREVFADSRVSYAKHTISDFIKFFIFLCAVCGAAYLAKNPSTHHMTKEVNAIFVDKYPDSYWDQFRQIMRPSIREPIRTFRQLKTNADYWRFLLYTILPCVTYDPKTRTVFVSNDINVFATQNIMLTPVRIRQLRVHNDSCQVHPRFKRFVKGVCNDFFSTSTQSKDFYGDVSSRFIYSEDSDVKEGSYWGHLAVYPPGGFIEVFPATSVPAYYLMSLLITTQFIDESTRAVFIDLATYNANANLFTAIRLFTEFTPAGGLIVTPDILVVNLLRYDTLPETMALVCVGICALFILIYALEQIVAMSNFGVQYWTNLWSYVELLLIAAGITAVVLAIINCLTMHADLAEKLLTTNKYVDYYSLAQKQYAADIAMGFLVFFAWVKLFRYLDFVRSMNYVSVALKECVLDLLGFSVMFIVVFLAFVQFAYLVFGTHIEEFSTFGNSVYTMLRITLGNFDMHTLDEADPVLTFVFFLMYVFFIFFILMNMFLVIICQTYVRFRDDVGQHDTKLQVFDYIKRILHRRKAGDSRFDPWRDRMLEYYNNEDIDEIIRRHASDPPPLTPEMEAAMTQELDEHSKSLFGSSVTHGEVTSILFRRIESLEESFKVLDEKVGELIDRYTDAEIAFMKRKYAYSKILEAIAQAHERNPDQYGQIAVAIKRELDRLDELEQVQKQDDVEFDLVTALAAADAHAMLKRATDDDDKSKAKTGDGEGNGEGEKEREEEEQD